MTHLDSLANSLANSLADSLGRAASAGGGAVLGSAFRTVGAVRPARKPLHPRGRVVGGRLRRHGSAPETGVAFLDEPGDEPVLVRESRSVGLPGPLPDIQGLAVRVSNPDGSPGDLLLASTGWGPWNRFVLTPSSTTYGRPMTTLFPYRSPRGPLLLGARSDTPGLVELAVALGRGPWRTFAELTVSDQDAGDPTVSFDPVLHQVAGLEQYPAVVRLREPAYRSARRSRGA
ncbi:hypothetical protein [Nocardioides sp.]|uniref:hypothetical protein n=1 Tax=Nocardioides sp. TaxID=35761 RepID=UPI001A23A762|nr:hypothetical protein [Nocardioides sp.]MBJ7357860.1 hypothetical protein [Nocardioides sp.]